MNFGEAVELAKQGELVTREGWNGKGMFIFMRPMDTFMSVDFVVHNVKSLPQGLKDYFKSKFAWTANEEAKGIGPKDIKVKFTSYLCMKAADDTIVNGWLASQTDMLAEDWKKFEF